MNSCQRTMNHPSTEPLGTDDGGVASTSDNRKTVKANNTNITVDTPVHISDLRLT
jgi:hypothetical protein